MGRPPIGPKMQGAVPPEIFACVERIANAREVPMSVVWREMMIGAYNAGVHRRIARQHGVQVDA
jgi:hypothetical protein